MLALRRLAAAGETRPLAGVLVAAGSTPLLAAQQHIQPLPASAALHPRSSSSSRSAQHQRRHSSSKPSSPPNDDAIAPAGAAGTAPSKESTGSAPQARKKASRSGRIKDGRDTQNQKSGIAGPSVQAKHLPSVPATEHLDAQAVNLASFFSLHRPISVTAPVPLSASASSFAALFQPSEGKQSARRVNDNLLTLASAVRVFDKAINQHQQQHQQQQQSNEAEGSPVMYISMQDLAQEMRPFHPPPPPPLRLRSSFPTSQAQHSVPQHLLASLLQRNLMALRARLAHKRQSNSSYADRMRARRHTYLANILSKSVLRAVAVWRAISVRRQRKLKMKKHKFKKLLKRQKNEKRRQDRL